MKSKKSRSNNKHTKSQAQFQEWIRVYGAREHNLKHVDVSIPKNALTVITGPSGSGKSSLALDVLFAEGQRRYMESLSSYVRQFLGTMKKAEVDRIDGLCPAIAIEQKTVGSNPRSTVGTITEIYDYLRVLYARIGSVHCATCKTRVQAQGADQITQIIVGAFTGKTVHFLAPLVRQEKGEFTKLLLKFFHQGWYQFIIDGLSYKFQSEDEIQSLNLKKSYKHSIDLILDVCQVGDVSTDEQARIYEAVEKSISIAHGLCKVVVDDQEYLYSSHNICLTCAQSIPELEPRIFSFNSPIGACPHCSGLGIVHEWPWSAQDPDNWKTKHPDFFADKYAFIQTCRACKGLRLNPQALAVTLGEHNIMQLCQLSIQELQQFFAHVQLESPQQEIASSLLTDIQKRLQFLMNVGLSYLSLNRSARTLSGGEGQRIRLASQIGSALSGVLYVLDEPSIGLHQRDNDRLIATLQELTSLGNTVVVVEHDLDTIAAADYIIDMGPGAGVHGGRVTAAADPEQLKKDPNSLTGQYLARTRTIAMPESLRTPRGWLKLSHAQKNNLKDLTVRFPLGVICGISGVSGSGKSTLVMQELVPALEHDLSKRSRYQSVEVRVPGSQLLEYMVVIDQSPIGRTLRSNPVTYLGVFDHIRNLFAQLPESKARGYSAGRFSFNVAQGRCFECSGEGIITVNMQFLPEVTMICKICKGKRYNSETLQITYRGKDISQVLEMTVCEAVLFFASHANIVRKLRLLQKVGLDYLKLGQLSTTLSGGEAQRIKLVNELSKRGSNTFYILDEPTTGLHLLDIEKLLMVLHKLVEKGNSIVVIEHNIDVLKTFDYLIDLGPEGGEQGGQIIAQGTPEQVAASQLGHTSRYLQPYFSRKLSI